MPIGVYKRKPIIKKGDKFNRLTAIRFVEMRGDSQQYWLFKCECGNEKILFVGNVKNGNTKACKCMQKEMRAKAWKSNLRHGLCNSKTYKSWVSMKQRCSNKSLREYKDYGGRGIIICEEWLKFENFYKDMGDRPNGKTLDRIDNSKGYYKENCKWSTRKEQANNTRQNHFLTCGGETKTIAQWSEELNIKYMTIWFRINKYNWSAEKALNK